MRLVFVAEAPPSAQADRFFYFEDVRTHDALFLNLMRAVYLDVRHTKPPKRIRMRKRELLEAFKADGYYLIDATEEPMPDEISDAEKRRILTDALPTLRRKVAGLSDGGRVPFILISGAVFDACRNELKRCNVNVLNREPIDFPLGNWQKRFHERISRLLTGEFAPRRSGVFG